MYKTKSYALWQKILFATLVCVIFGAMYVYYVVHQCMTVHVMNAVCLKELRLIM